MAELAKSSACWASSMQALTPHFWCWMPTGQNALTQAQAFLETASITGLIMTKLDGTARGGCLVPVATKLHLPVHFIGVGEQVEDLQEFSADDFSRALTGANCKNMRRDTTGKIMRKTLKNLARCLYFCSECARSRVAVTARNAKPVCRHGRVHDCAWGGVGVNLSARRTTQ